jgi:hypothetical protein
MERACARGVPCPTAEQLAVCMQVVLLQGIAANRGRARTLAVISSTPMADACSPARAAVAARAFFAGAPAAAASVDHRARRASESVRSTARSNADFKAAYAEAVSRIELERSLLFAPLDLATIVVPALIATDEAARASAEATVAGSGWDPLGGIDEPGFDRARSRELYYKVLLVDAVDSDQPRSGAKYAELELCSWMRAKLSIGGASPDSSGSPQWLSLRWSDAHPGYRVGLSVLVCSSAVLASVPGHAAAAASAAATTRQVERGAHEQPVHGCTGVVVVAPCDARGVLLDVGAVRAEMDAAVRALCGARAAAVPLVVLLASPHGWEPPFRSNEGAHSVVLDVAIAAARELRMSALPVAAVGRWAVICSASVVLPDSSTPPPPGGGHPDGARIEHVYAVVGVGASAETVCATARCDGEASVGPRGGLAEYSDDASGTGDGGIGAAVAWRGNSAFAITTALQLIAGWSPAQPVS